MSARSASEQAKKAALEAALETALVDDRVQRKRWLRRIRWTHSNGPLGLGLGIGVMVGMQVGWPLALASGAAWLVLMIREVINSTTALDKLARAFPDSENFGEHLRGRCDDIAFVVHERHESVLVKALLPVDCKFVLVPVPSRAPIGDDEFDATFEVTGDELAWRIALTAAIRVMLVANLPHSQLATDRIILELSDEIARGEVLERAVRSACSIASLLARELDGVSDDPAQRRAALLAKIPDEPVVAIRKRHYEWLVENGHDAPPVYLVASRDPDPAIAAWAREHLGPEVGVFR